MLKHLVVEKEHLRCEVRKFCRKRSKVARRLFFSQDRVDIQFTVNVEFHAAGIWKENDNADRASAMVG